MQLANDESRAKEEMGGPPLRGWRNRKAVRQQDRRKPWPMLLSVTTAWKVEWRDVEVVPGARDL